MLLSFVESGGDYDISIGICLELGKFLLRSAAKLDGAARPKLAKVADAPLHEGDAVIADSDSLVSELVEFVS